jgi:glucose-6-phosphate isomerase
MMFGAWCDRQYGFVYDGIRAHHGLAWFPVLDSEWNIRWEPNPSYRSSELSIRSARGYPELGLDPNTPIYEQFAANPESVQWVSQPASVATVWPAFEM